jgi:hypothetical protein
MINTTSGAIFWNNLSKMDFRKNAASCLQQTQGLSCLIKVNVYG